MKEKKNGPPGRIKIMKALSDLIKQKDFHSITTAEIAFQAGVTEGLIYKYFKDKRDLLYTVLEEYFDAFREYIKTEVATRESSTEKLEVIIRTNIESWSENRVFARILLLEVRSSPDYYKSRAYELVKKYYQTIVKIIEQGMEKGEIRRDIKPEILTKEILGAIEHSCLGDIIFERSIDVDLICDNICKTVFRGVMP
ncbi:MAG: TetR/AcrR family transcriptional regulator [Desulfobacteraceae bacterium]